jgi:hypothetical protein
MRRAMSPATPKGDQIRAVRMDGVWVLMSGGDEAGYWHYECNPAQVFPDRTYDLMIRISEVGQGIERVLVTPTLNGGGIELP